MNEDFRSHKLKLTKCLTMLIQGGHSLHIVISHTSRYNQTQKQTKAAYIYIYTCIYVYV